MVLVCLGKIAFDATWRVLDSVGRGVSPRPPFAHGAVHRAGDDWSVIATYHPSRQNTNTGRLTRADAGRDFPAPAAAAPAALNLNLNLNPEP